MKTISWKNECSSSNFGLIEAGLAGFDPCDDPRCGDGRMVGCFFWKSEWTIYGNTCFFYRNMSNFGYRSRCMTSTRSIGVQHVGQVVSSWSPCEYFHVGEMVD